MHFDFDQVIERRGGDSIKWNRYGDRDVLPLWVADMDFAAPPAVLEALHRRVDHGVFGYAQPWPSLTAAVLEHLAGEFSWPVDPSWLVWLPGLVTGLNVACRAVGGSVFTATPIYPPFLSAPRLAGRTLFTEPLVLDDKGWRWDFAATEETLEASGAKLLLLCHPHNPVGRAWRDDELARIGMLAEKNDLVVCSDEIHCGLMLDPDRRHRPFATLSDAAAQRSITLMAPSKTFNVPGLGCAFAIIPEPGLRHAFRAAMDGIVPHVNILGLAACEAALREGGVWRSTLLDYLRGNRDRLATSVATLPGLAMAPVEASYLAWIDTSAAAISAPSRFFEHAGVGLSDGGDFGIGDQYGSFVRLNFGCPRATLDKAIERMARALVATS